MGLVSTILKQAFSLLSSFWVIANLSFWFLLLMPMALVRLLFPYSKPYLRRPVAWIYRAAVRVDSFWMKRVVNIRLNVSGSLPDHPAPIVICNHQSWFDIPIVQDTVALQGPIIKFLIKRQLVWVPIIGWICLLLDFPRLYRGSHEEARAQDYAAIESASSELSSQPGALLVFAEGTRFTKAKRERLNSPYTRLLPPRVGGLKILKANADPDTPVVDMTIDYRGDTNFWRCLHGANQDIYITMDTFRLGDIEDISDWLSERWQIKERAMTRSEVP